MKSSSKTNYAKYEYIPTEILEKKLREESSKVFTLRDLESELQKALQDSKTSLQVRDEEERSALKEQICQMRESHTAEMEALRLESEKRCEDRLESLRAMHALEIEREKSQSSNLQNRIAELQEQVESSKKIIGELERQQKEKISSGQQELQQIRAKQTQELLRQEETWKDRLEQQKVEAQESLANQQQQYEQENKAKEFSLEAQLEAKLAEKEQQYLKKVHKLEKQVERALQIYQEKALYMNGVLDQMHRDHEVRQAEWQGQMEVLREELTLKDHRMGSLQRKIEEVYDVEKSRDSWRDEAALLAERVVRLAASARRFPDSLDGWKQRQQQLLFNFANLNNNSGNAAHPGEELFVPGDHIVLERRSLRKAFDRAKKLIEKIRDDEDRRQLVREKVR